jgi:hypothetical protein
LICSTILFAQTETLTIDAIYNNHYLRGDTFYIDINNDFAKAKNTHFEIDVTKKN